MISDDKLPKPFFHLSENFSSAFFGKVPDDAAGSGLADAKTIANFLSLIKDPNHRERKVEVLAILRNNNAQDFLVSLIADPSNENYLRELISACWETGLDFSAHLIFFAQLVINCGYPEALEAITVIDEMRKLKDIQILKKAIEILSEKSLSAEKQALIADTLGHLRSIS